MTLNNNQEKLQYFQYLDISTAHISKKEEELLTLCSTDEDAPLTVFKYDCGFFVYIPVSPFDPIHLIEYGFSDNFINILKLPKNCIFIRFDSDGTVYNNLPTYSW